MNFNALGLKRLTATCYATSPVVYTQLDLFGGNGGPGVSAVTVSLKSRDKALDKAEYESVCEFYGFTPKTEPTASDFKVVSKDAQIVPDPLHDRCRKISFA